MKRASRRGGYALIGVLFFILLMLSLLGVAYRQIAVRCAPNRFAWPTPRATPAACRPWPLRSRFWKLACPPRIPMSAG